MNKANHMIDTILANAKSFWPDFHITKANVLNPTAQFVHLFYSQFLMEFEEKITSILKFDQFDDRADPNLDEYEYIFLKMQTFNLIFKQADTEFLLGDICAPTFLRTKHFMYMCVHVIVFLNNPFTNLEKIVNDNLEKRELTAKMLSERDELSNIIDTLAKKKAQLMESYELLPINIKCKEKELKDYCRKREENQLEMKEQELERLKMCVEEKRAFIEKLELKEKQYKEEVVTEEESLHLKMLIENLVKEKESLTTEDANMEYCLSHENVVLNHFRECEKAVPDSFNVDLVKEQLYLEILIDDIKEKKKNILSDLSSNKTLQIQQTKLLNESKESYNTANKENRETMLHIQQKSKELLKELQLHYEKTSTSKREALSTNVKIRNETAVIQNDIERLRETFKREYVKVAKAEKEAFNKFKANLESLTQND